MADFIKYEILWIKNFILLSLQQMVSGSTFVFAGYPFQQKQKGYFKHIVLLETVLKKLGGKLVNRAVKLNDWEFISNQ